LDVGINKAIILAAGGGTRMGYITHDKPKCLLEIDGKTILQHQIETLEECEIKDIILVVGFKVNLVEDFCKKHFWNINFVYNTNYACSENLYSLLVARQHFGDGFVCLNGDVLFDIKIMKELLSYDKEDIIVVTAQKQRYNKEDMKVKLQDGTTRIETINKTMQLSDADAVSIGISKFSNRGATHLLRTFNNMDEIKNTWLGLGYQKLVDKGYDIHTFDIHGQRWTEIDFESELTDARKRKW
jgi:choline kinase